MSIISAHDLPLPAWGPYSKRYAGASHIPDSATGLRLDLSVFPGFYRGRIDVPHVCFESGWTPWRATSDGQSWEFRHELIGRDELVLLVRYRIDGDGVRVTATCTNATDAPETLSLHLVVGCQYPAPNPSGHAPQEVLIPALVEADQWLDARDFSAAAPRDAMTADGRCWREIRASGFVDGGGLALRAGDHVRWPGVGPCWLRWRVPGGAWQLRQLPDPEFTASESCELDGLAWGSAPRFSAQVWQPAPEVRGDDHQLALSYSDLGTTYQLSWDRPGRVRVWSCESLDLLLRHKTHDHVSARFEGPGLGHWTDVVIEPIAVPPRSSITFEARLAADGRADLTPLPELFPISDDLGQQVLAATLLTNVVYPVYTRRGYVRHQPPGKAWDSLYTWDSGFIGLGLLELDVDRAYATLCQYLMPADEPDQAWLHHGSPVPVQIHLAQAWFNRTRDLAQLRQVWPGLRQFHRFLAGRHQLSHTDRFASRLLQTWGLFYNSGGWDDYPAQQQVHREGLTAHVAPAITTSQVIRTAKHLRHFGALLGEPVAEFDDDIARLSAALQTHSWNDAEGWFSYVRHDDLGRPCGPLRHAGEDANRGLDGLAPLVAGICNPAQTERLLAHLDHGLWTSCGVTAVDTRAAAHRIDGYWNGTVWFAHQWFLWRALLDLGESVRAWRIAKTALAVWRTEVERSRRSWEHIVCLTGRGAGWHHFGGLSSPVLAFHAAYHAAERISGGFDCWVVDQRPGYARLELLAQTQTVLLVSERPPSWNGQLVPAQRQGRAWAITLAGGTGDMTW